MHIKNIDKICERKSTGFQLAFNIVFNVEKRTETANINIKSSLSTMLMGMDRKPQNNKKMILFSITLTFR